MTAASRTLDRAASDSATGARPSRRAPVAWLTWCIRGYQLARSGRPTGCRYLPTCSEYAVEALERHGLVRGSLLAARRLTRCHPWGGQGFDPVPERRVSCTHH
ncbi:MAG: membrane protein insertion efficiency factor YidD [Acidimicrobiales bacterium]